MNDKIAKLLNEQINKEFYSAYLYLDISNYHDELNQEYAGRVYTAPSLVL